MVGQNIIEHNSAQDWDIVVPTSTTGIRLTLRQLILLF